MSLNERLGIALIVAGGAVLLGQRTLSSLREQRARSRPAPTPHGEPRAGRQWALHSLPAAGRQYTANSKLPYKLRQECAQALYCTLALVLYQPAMPWPAPAPALQATPAPGWCTRCCRQQPPPLAGSSSWATSMDAQVGGWVGECVLGGWVFHIWFTGETHCRGCSVFIVGCWAVPQLLTLPLTLQLTLRRRHVPVAGAPRNSPLLAKLLPLVLPLPLPPPADELRALLEKLQYRRGVDLLLAVGDLVNKGPDSQQVGAAGGCFARRALRNGQVLLQAGAA